MGFGPLFLPTLGGLGRPKESWREARSLNLVAPESSNPKTPKTPKTPKP